MSNITKFYKRPSLLGRSVWDDVFDNFFNEHEAPNLIRRSTDGYPVTDLYRDEEGNSIIECALAGFNKNQLSIEVKEGKITIIADQGSETGENSRRIARRSFTRTFVDHSNKLDLENAKATFKDGLLQITVPPTPEVKSTIIKIK
jgi:HSP20 family molecular chaperone IbpA